MGMVTQLGKFSPNVAQLSQPLRSLLSNKLAWCWGPAQQESFSHLKTELVKPTVLTYYNLEAYTKVSADASSYGLGAVLLQLTNSVWKPVSFASRSMSDTELRYAQIEKEALATTWACDKFKDFLIGKHFCIETDHKPLVRLLYNGLTISSHMFQESSCTRLTQFHMLQLQGQGKIVQIS